MRTIADRLLQAALDERIPVVLFFVKGTAIPKCVVLEFDESSILVRHGEILQLLFRPALTSIEFPPGWTEPAQEPSKT